METVTWGSPAILVEIGKAVVLALAAIAAALFARWRYQTADRQLLQERFQTASKLLAKERMKDENESGMIRVSSVVILGKLAQEEPEEYHVAVMRIFEIFLTWTTVFGPERRVVDPEANDVVEAIRFVETRTKRQKAAEKKANYKFRLRGESPFYMGEDSKLYLKDMWVPEVCHELRKRNIDSPFMVERHPNF